MKIFRKRLKEVLEGKHGALRSIVHPFRRLITPEELTYGVFHGLWDDYRLRPRRKIELPIPSSVYAIVDDHAVNGNNSERLYMKYGDVFLATVHGKRWLIALGYAWDHLAKKKYGNDISAIPVLGSAKSGPELQRLVETAVERHFNYFLRSLFFTTAEGEIALCEQWHGRENPYHEKMIENIRVNLHALSNSRFIRKKSHRHIDRFGPADGEEIFYRRDGLRVLVNAIADVLSHVSAASR